MSAAEVMPATMGHQIDRCQGGHPVESFGKRLMGHCAGMPRHVTQPPGPGASAQAHALYAFMRSRGLTQYAWTRSAGVPKNILRNLFKGETQNLDYDTLKKLAAAVSCTVPALTGEANEPEGVEEAMRGSGPGYEVLKALLAEQQRQNELQGRILDTLAVIAKALRVNTDDAPEVRLQPTRGRTLPKSPRPQ